MSDDGFVEVNQLPTTPEFLCPFLAMLNDAETYSANIDFKNYCHKAMPVAPVSVDHQTHICCTEDYRNCIVYKATKPRNLPPEWCNVETDEANSNRNRWGMWVYAGITLASLLLAIFIFLNWHWFSGRFHQIKLNIAPITYPITTPTQEGSMTATITVSTTPLPTATLQSTVQATNSQTVSFTQTPTLLLTETLSLPSPTPGPELETPFGAQPLFLVHRVKEGESLSVIAANFKTSYAVIEVVNNLTSDSLIREGMDLVVMPGQTSQIGVPVVKAIYLTATIRVEDFAATYGADVAEVRLFNGLGLDDWIYPNRWLVVRGK